MARRTDINWGAIEIDYRVGTDSIKKVAKKYGVAESNLRLKAKREGWIREGSSLVSKATEEALAATVRCQASEIGAQIGAEKARLVRAGLEEVVMDSVEVVQQHQRDARRAMRLVEEGLAELEELTRALPQLHEDLRQLAAVNPAQAALLAKALGLKSRMETLDRLATAMSKFTAIERQAHGLDKDQDSKGSEIDELLKKVHAERVARGEI